MQRNFKEITTWIYKHLTKSKEQTLMIDYFMKQLHSDDSSESVRKEKIISLQISGDNDNN